MGGRKRGRIVIALICGSAWGLARSASGALFASMDLEQNIQYELPGSPVDVFSAISDSTVPFNTRLSLNTGNGATITTTYNIYDNGSSAGLSINTSAYSTAENTGVGEETQDYHYSSKHTSFSFSAPVYFSLKVSGTGSVINGVAVAEGVVQVEPYASNETGYGLPGTSAGANYSQSFSGLIGAGEPCELDEYFAFGNPSTATSNVPPVYAMESIVLTFTPVPEPSSAALIAAAAGGVFRRRRRAVCSAGAGL